MTIVITLHIVDIVDIVKIVSAINIIPISSIISITCSSYIIYCVPTDFIVIQCVVENSRVAISG